MNEKKKKKYRWEIGAWAWWWRKWLELRRKHRAEGGGNSSRIDESASSMRGVDEETLSKSSRVSNPSRNAHFTHAFRSHSIQCINHKQHITKDQYQHTKKKASVSDIIPSFFFFFFFKLWVLERESFGKRKIGSFSHVRDSEGGKVVSVSVSVSFIYLYIYILLFNEIYFIGCGILF